MAKKKFNISSEEDVLFEETELIAQHRDTDDKEINSQIGDSMLSYGEYIIENRAIPFCLDGFKPSQRRSMYTFKYDNSIGKKVKLARISGLCIGVLHPHGDTSINDTLANMTQPWKTNYSFFTGQGNWGSPAGDSVAAARYVEIQLNKEADDLIFDNINKTDVVTWQDNYDGTLKEPRVLPVKYPYHLINGTTGIAYSLATSIAPFNIKELTDSFIYLIDNEFWKTSFDVENHKESLSQIIQGPDFPTGCDIYFDKKSTAESTIFTPSTKVFMRAKYELDEANNVITISNIPYNVTTDKIKEELLKMQLDYTVEKKRGGKENRIPKNPNEILYLKEAPNVKFNKKNPTDLTITLVFKPSADLNVEIVKILTQSSLEKSYSANMTVINDKGLPVEMSLYQNIVLFLKFRRHVVYQGFLFDLNKIEQQIKMLNAVLIVLKGKEEFIDVITTSDNVKEDLKQIFSELDNEQIDYVLDIKVNKLTKNEVAKIENDIKSKSEEVANIKDIIKDSASLFKYIKNDYENLLINNKNIKAANRKSKILNSVGKLTIEDTIKDESIILMLMDDETIGYIEKSKFRPMNRGSQLKNSKVNKNGFEMKASVIYDGMLKDECFFMTNKGRIFKESLWKFNKKFSNIRNFFPNLEDDEEIIKIVTKENDTDNKNIILISNHMIKNIPLNLFNNVTPNMGKYAIKLKEGDLVRSILINDTELKESVIILAQEGKIIKFDKDLIPELKSGNSVGRKAMNKAYNVLDAFLVKKDKEDNTEILIVSDIGKGKKVSVSEIPEKKIAQSPNNIFDNNKRNGNILKGLLITPNSDEEIVMISESGNVSIIKVKSDLRTTSRTAKGSFKLISNEDNEKIIYVAKHDASEKESLEED